MSLRGIAAALPLLLVAASPAAANDATTMDDFSPTFLGMYRKLTEIDGEIRRHAARYSVDPDLARVVCLYESGANPGLVSAAGAQGFFQVMPATFEDLGVATNIEAGVKYLARLIQQFGREDRAVAAYNAGPGRVGRAGSIPLETLQYVVGVGEYRRVLKQYEVQLQRYTQRLRLEPVREGDDWPTIAARLGHSESQLRVHNAFLAGRRLRPGQQVAYPVDPRSNLFTTSGRAVMYRTRLGDNYIAFASTLGLDLDALREENGLWQLQAVPVGTVLRVPPSVDRLGLAGAAVRREPTPAIANALRDDLPGRRQRAAVVHTVVRGDTLTAIARNYATTVEAIRRRNRLRTDAIRVGQRLRIDAEQAAGAM